MPFPINKAARDNSIEPMPMLKSDDMEGIAGTNKSTATVPVIVRRPRIIA
jgi:hypothetical protein